MTFAMTLHTSLLGKVLTCSRGPGGGHDVGTVVAVWIGDNGTSWGNLVVALGLENGNIIVRSAADCQHAQA